ncbi:MAG: dipeptide epimerase [Micrococcales bacterium]|nr:dipeptide epimerase [Micrococcales bacterium]
MKLSAHQDTLQLSQPFGISRGVKTSAEVVRVQISDGSALGLGEAVPYARYGDSSDKALSQIAKLPNDFSRHDLTELLPAGSARNAVDAALLDLESKVAGQPASKVRGLAEPQPVEMCYTISLQQTEKMIAEAQQCADLPVLKVKLGGQDDQAAILGIAEAAPDSKIIVDVNEGWNIDTLKGMIPYLVQAGVELLEQPIPAAQDNQLALLDCPIPLCADEGISPGMEIRDVCPSYSFVNLKLDKSGGLTHALEQLNQARDLGLGVMVGCMVGSSLAMAPGFLLAQQADYVDLDGFLHIAQDTAPALRFESGLLSAPEGLWG